VSVDDLLWEGDGLAVELESAAGVGVFKSTDGKRKKGKI